MSEIFNVLRNLTVMTNAEKSKADVFDSGAVHALRVNQVDVINTLRSTGDLILDETQEKRLSHHLSHSQHGQLLEPDTALLIDHPFMELLLQLNGLDAAERHFRLFCIADLTEELKGEIEAYRYRRKIKEWLGTLSSELKHLRDKGKLKTLTVRQPTDKHGLDQPLTHEILEILAGTEGLG